MHKWVCPESCCHLVNSHCPIYVLKSVLQFDHHSSVLDKAKQMQFTKWNVRDKQKDLRCWSPSVYKWTPAPTSQMIAYAALSILCLLKPSIQSCTPSQLGKCLCIICKMRNGAECIIKIKAPCWQRNSLYKGKIKNMQSSVYLPYRRCSPLTENTTIESVQTCQGQNISLPFQINRSNINQTYLCFFANRK